MRRIIPWLILLSATSCAPAPEVAPPMVMTVVVTATGGAPTTEAATPAPTPPPTSAYPAPFQTSITAVYGPFERGFMIYLSDRQAIWVFIQSYMIANTGGTPPATTPNFGVWMGFADTFKEGDPETDPNIAAPAGFLQPKRGFGKVWREHPEVRDALGWATDYERPYAAAVSDYSIGVFDSVGSYTPQSFIHTVTTIDGAVIHVDEAARVWTRP